MEPRVSENGEMIVEKLCWELRTKKKRVQKDLLLERNITTEGRGCQSSPGCDGRRKDSQR